MESTHQLNFASLGDRVEVTACVDPVLERAERSAAVLGGRSARDLAEVIDEVDAVLGVLPHHLHHTLGVAALKAGKHLLMEKPLAFNEDEVLELIHEAKQRNLVLMTAYPMRYHPVPREVKRLIDERTYGDVFHLSIWTEQYTHYEADHWTNSMATLGGGQLFSHGCHYIDLLLWFLGRPASGAHFGNHLGTPWMEGEGTSDVTIKFENGIVGYHMGTWGAKGSKLGYAIHVQCDDGMIEADIHKGRIFFHRAGESTLIYSAPTMAKNVGGELREFIECIETGKRPQTDAEQSLEGLKVIWKLYEAEDRGEIADLRGIVSHPDFQGPPPRASDERRLAIDRDIHQETGGSTHGE